MQTCLEEISFNDAVRVLDECAETSSMDNIGHQFERVIDRQYRFAISHDKTPRSGIAYGCFLESHGHFEKALREFEVLLELVKRSKDTNRIVEIVGHLARVNKRLRGQCIFE